MDHVQSTQEPEAFAKAKVLGILAENPQLRHKPPKDIPFCEVIVKVNDQDIPIRFEGEKAQQLASLKKGDLVSVTGQLQRYTWVVNRAIHSRMIVRGEHLG